MVRNYIPKRLVPPLSEDVLLCAVTEVIAKRMTIRVAAEYFSVKRSTLGDYVKKVKNNGDVVPSILKSVQHSRQILSKNLENELASYLMKCSLMSHGLTPMQTRHLAYLFAVANHVEVPSNWITAKEASRDWFTGFVKRNSSLSIRAPEATSQSRAKKTSYDKL